MFDNIGMYIQKREEGYEEQEKNTHWLLLWIDIGNDVSLRYVGF